MKTHNYAKVFGWAQFIAQFVGQISIAPHGWIGWLGTAASLATAVAVHAASSTDGTK